MPTIARIGRETMKPNYRHSEVGLIPIEWEVVRIKDHTVIKTGKRNTQDRSDDGLYPFFVRSQTVERINSYSFEGEAVLTAGDGVGTGKVFHYINGRFDYHQRVYRISDFSPKLDGRFFCLVFSTRFYDRIMSMTAKSSVDSVRLDMIANMPIPLPPLQEQRAIAAVLADIDALLGALDRLIAKKRDLKQAAMQQLLTGQTRLPGFAEQWDVGHLGQLLERLANGALYQPGGPSGLPVTRIETIANGTINMARTGYARPTPQLEEYRMRDGDILFSHINSVDHIGKVALYRDGPPLYHGMNLLLLRPGKQLLSLFLFYWLGSHRGRKISASLARQAVSQASINTGDLRRVEVPLPSRPEQAAIADLLSDMDAELASLEQRRDKTRAIKQGMMQELLTGRIRLL